jgi:hypothetical protein
MAMTMKRVVLAGMVVGGIVSGTILALFWFGVAGVLRMGHTNLMLLLWPSSVMLVGGWRTTVPGVLITISSVAINCLLYGGIVCLLRWAMGVGFRLFSSRT